MKIHFDFIVEDHEADTIFACIDQVIDRVKDNKEYFIYLTELKKKMYHHEDKPKEFTIKYEWDKK